MVVTLRILTVLLALVGGRSTCGDVSSVGVAVGAEMGASAAH